ncbi:hypothetical protein AKJ09_07044 [Labilithrix luteola]|uniref:NAD(P)-binding domain-containing protein n=1 Tax=Labilithrix luteola TaxID=1391654 RepID=A0A0K1Q3F6_9BACT|nr:hypothetical protein AKJ09_07044 [Labilithrix luteola]
MRELDSKGARFRVLVRDLGRATTVPESAERFVGDIGRPETLGPAFEGVDKLFLLTQGIGTEYAANSLAAAKRAGVRHIVFLSSYSVAPEYLAGNPLPAMARWHHEREVLLRDTGIPATILRPGGFMTNALDWLPTLREGGYVIDAIGPGRYAPIDTADVGAVAAHTLLTAGHDDKAYVLTGDESLTISEQVRILANALGRHIEVREAATPADAVRSRFPNGAPPALAEAITEGFRIMRADTRGFRTDTVERLLGRRPTSFADWCRKNASAFHAP